MINFAPLSMDGVYTVENFSATDNRGVFVKTFNADSFIKAGFKQEFKESYYSTSLQNVIRGMHFQIPPYEHDKLVYVVEGKILDVILDIRLASPTFGKCISLELIQNGPSVLIPKGCAHGFLTLSKRATVVYNVTSVHNVVADKGIHWKSFGFNWPVDTPVVSARDDNFETLKDFTSPFK